MKILSYKYSLPIIIALAIALILFRQQVKVLIFVLGFSIFNIAITSYKKYVNLPMEIEFITLGTVLCSSVYGFKAGLIVALLGGAGSSLFYGFVSPFIIPVVIGYVLVAALSAVSPYSIVITGNVINLVKNVFVFFFYHQVFNYDVGKNTMFAVTNILLNLALFFNVAPYLLMIM